MSILLCTWYASQAQGDGQLILQTPIEDLAALIDYVKATESRDSVSFDVTRFNSFNEVSVSGITYYSDGLKVKGFLLKPNGQGPYPAIIYNRGGSLEFGSLTSASASIGLGELAYLAAQGYVIAASQYRGNGGSEGKEEYGGSDINDVLNLIPLLAALPQADTSKLGMFGWSRGGMTSFLALKRSDRFKALVVGGPSTNLLSSIADRPDLSEWWEAFIPDFDTDRQGVLEKRSAILWVDELPKNVPMLILQGANDRSLPARYTLEFALELDKYKIPYRLILFENGSHSLREHKSEVFHQIIQWFHSHLQPVSK